MALWWRYDGVLDLLDGVVSLLDPCIDTCVIYLHRGVYGLHCMPQVLPAISSHVRILCTYKVPPPPPTPLLPPPPQTQLYLCSLRISIWSQHSPSAPHILQTCPSCQFTTHSSSSSTMAHELKNIIIIGVSPSALSPTSVFQPFWSEWPYWYPVSGWGQPRPFHPRGPRHRLTFHCLRPKPQRIFLQIPSTCQGLPHWRKLPRKRTSRRIQRPRWNRTLTPSQRGWKAKEDNRCRHQGRCEESDTRWIWKWHYEEGNHWCCAHLC